MVGNNSQRYYSCYYITLYTLDITREIVPLVYFKFMGKRLTSTARVSESDLIISYHIIMFVIS